jgi:hypothetical protein
MPAPITSERVDRGLDIPRFQRPALKAETKRPTSNVQPPILNKESREVKKPNTEYRTPNTERRTPNRNSFGIMCCVVRLSAHL